MAATASPTRPLTLRNYGGVHQISIVDDLDLAKIDSVDPARWAATSAPVKDLRCDPKLLEVLDTHSIGRIRVSEVIAARDWAFERLSGRRGFAQRSDALALADLDVSRESGQGIKKTAEHVLAELGAKDRTRITLDQVREFRASYVKRLANGDGVVCPDQVADPDASALAKDVVAVLGGVPERSGGIGADGPLLDRFLDRGRAWLAWHDQPKKNAALLPWRDDTDQAAELVFGLDAKIEEYFWHCELLRQQSMTADRLRLTDDELKAVRSKDGATLEKVLADAPIATPVPDGKLALAGPVNAVYKDRFDELASVVLPRALPGEKSLDRAAWRRVRSIFEPWRDWQKAKPVEPFDKVDAARLPKILNGPSERLRDAIAVDLAAQPELDRTGDLEKLILFQRWLIDLANNFVNFSAIYHPDRSALIEQGSLVIDGRRLDFCIRVENRDAHKKVASDSLMFLVYAAVSESDSGDKKTTFEVVAPVTSGERGRLRVGKRGIFIDVDGHEWDAVVVDIVENPISITEAMKSPFRRIGQLVHKKIEDFTASKLAAAEKEAHAHATGDHPATPGAPAAPATAAAPPATAPADPAPPPAAAPAGLQNLMIAGSLAFAAIGSALAYVLSALANVSPLKLVGGLGSIIGIVAALAGFLGWLKLRRRDMSLLMEANGWAVNVRMDVTRRLGRLFTRTPALPKGTRRLRGDELPPEELDEETLARRRKRRRAARLSIALGVVAVATTLYIIFPRVRWETRRAWYWSVEKLGGKPIPEPYKGPYSQPRDVGPKESEPEKK